MRYLLEHGGLKNCKRGRGRGCWRGLGLVTYEVKRKNQISEVRASSHWRNGELSHFISWHTLIK